MKHFAQALDLKNDPRLIAEYRAHHARVWPEVVAALRAAGIRDMRIYLLGNRLFMTFQAPENFDPARDYQQYASDPRCAEWDHLMRTYQQPTPFTTPGLWWAPMEQVFDLGAQP